MRNLMDTKTRDRLLERGMAILETLKYCREQSDRPLLGSTLENELVAPMLLDLALATSLAEIDEDLDKIKGVRNKEC